jgi:hypothetical protein
MNFAMKTNRVQGVVGKIDSFIIILNILVTQTPAALL